MKNEPTKTESGETPPKKPRFSIKDSYYALYRSHIARYHEGKLKKIVTDIKAFADDYGIDFNFVEGSLCFESMPGIVSLHCAFSLPEEGGLSIAGDTRMLSGSDNPIRYMPVWAAQGLGWKGEWRGVGDFKGWAISTQSVKENHRGNKFIAMDHIEQHVLSSIEDRSAIRFSYLVQVRGRQPEGNLQFIVATMPQPVRGTKRAPVGE